ncbi:MAG: signal peptidase II [Lachnospiraceae bacterium]|nr:signal peptidase II [Lachnospiraceae bacterium]
MKKVLTKGWIACCAALFMVLVILDRVSKTWAANTLQGNPRVLIEGVLELRYLENTGAAWGTMQGMQWLFYILTVVFLVLVLLEILRLRKDDRYLPLIYTLTVMSSGAAGNFIDRLTLKYVIDFVYIRLIDFPIFNLADCYITVSTAVLMILILFRYSGADLDYIIPGQKTEKETEKEQ